MIEKSPERSSIVQTTILSFAARAGVEIAAIASSKNERRDDARLRRILTFIGAAFPFGRNNCVLARNASGRAARRHATKKGRLPSSRHELSIRPRGSKPEGLGV